MAPRRSAYLRSRRRLLREIRIIDRHQIIGERPALHVRLGRERTGHNHVVVEDRRGLAMGAAPATAAPINRTAREPPCESWPWASLGP